MDETEQTSVETEAAQVKQLDAVLNDPTQLKLKDLTGAEHTFRLETFSTYKTAQVLKLLASLKEKVNLIQLLSEIITLEQRTDPADTKARADQVVAAFSAIPTLMEIAPDALLDFATIATFTNTELREAYTAGTVDALRQERKTLLNFEFDASTPLNILVSYIPFVGIDFLLQQIRLLNPLVANLIPQTTPPSTG